MEKLHVLDTIQVLAQVISLEATEFVPEVGCITQSVWTTGEMKAIKSQLRGLLSLIPEAKSFHKSSEDESS